MAWLDFQSSTRSQLASSDQAFSIDFKILSMSEITLDFPQTKRIGPILILDLIIHPRRAFEQIAASNRSTWRLPMLLLSLGVLVQVITAGYLRNRAAALGELVLPPDFEWWSPVMQNNYLQSIQTTQGVAYVFVIPAVMGLLGPWIGWPILSSLLHLASTLLGGRGSQASTLSMVAWAQLPYLLRNLLRSVYMLAANHLITSPGLSGFVIGANKPAFFLSNLLKQTDVFLIWQILLLGIGLSQLNGLSRSRTWLAVVLVHLIALLALAGFSTLFASLSGSVISRPFYF